MCLNSATGQSSYCCILNRYSYVRARSRLGLFSAWELKSLRSSKIWFSCACFHLGALTSSLISILDSMLSWLKIWTCTLSKHYRSQINNTICLLDQLFQHHVFFRPFYMHFCQMFIFCLVPLFFYVFCSVRSSLNSYCSWPDLTDLIILLQLILCLQSNILLLFVYKLFSHLDS